MASEGLRPLGHHERYNVARNSLGLYTSVASTGRYTISTRLIQDLGGLEGLIHSTVKRLVQRHPALGLSVLGETTKAPSWVRLQTIDLREVVRYETLPEEEIERYGFVEDEHQMPFERVGELPLWRLVVVRGKNDATETALDRASDEPPIERDITLHVGFFYHHVIGDGGSGPAFHVYFLNILNALKAGDYDSKLLEEPVVKVPQLPLLPNIEKAHPLPLTFRFMATQIFEGLIYSRKDPLRWTGPPVSCDSKNPPRTRLLPLILDSDRTNKLSQLCRRKQTTVTPLLTVLIARILASTYQNYKTFVACIPLSLRNVTGVSKQELVCHVSWLSLQFSTAPKNDDLSCDPSTPIDWNIVRSCKTVINSGATSHVNQGIGLVRFMTNPTTFLKDKIGKPRNSQSFEVSNLGAIDCGTQKTELTARLQRIVFSQPAIVTEAPYVFNVASVKGGDMAITLTWQQDILTDDEAKGVFDALEKELEALTQE